MEQLKSVNVSDKTVFICGASALVGLCLTAWAGEAARAVNASRLLKL